MSTADADRLFDFYLDVLSIVGTIVAPLSVIAVLYAWWFVWRYRREGATPVITVVLAVVASIAAPCALWIGWLSFLRIRGETAPLWTPPISAAVFILLDFIPLIVWGYLIWLDLRRARINTDKVDAEPPAPIKRDAA